MKNKKMRNITVHHIIPRSRNGKTTKGNLADVEQGHHQDYHKLFGTRTPIEILDYLSNYFWKTKEGHNGDKHLREFLNNIPYRSD